MASWTLDDIPWDRFDPAQVDAEILRLVKAASLVEQNGADYARYLCGVFHDDAEFQEAARRWGTEETQHGQALGRWAMLADPQFDHAAAVARFTAGFRVDLDASTSVRGSRASELVARCIVETGTSSYYTALAEATGEPVLREICKRIAGDELRHYKLFYTHMQRHLEAERIGFWRRLRVAAGRVAEAEDDELAYAYYAANEVAAPYDRRRFAAAYARRAYAVYRRHHVERGIAMIFKAVGLKPHGRLNLWAARLAWWGMCRRAGRLERIAA
ncbi:MAG TPA: ferritin-like domain-containing protein [Stellaceae bacterium]